MMHEHMTTEIPVSSIEIGVFSPRKTFNTAYVNELAESIEMRGLLKPLTVRPDPSQAGRYQLIDGEHRLRALKLKGVTLARCEIVSADDKEALIMAFAANDLHGKKLDPVEEAFHIKRMMTEHGYTQQQIGAILRKTQGWVSQRLGLAERLNPEVQQSVISRLISPGQAIEVARLDVQVQPRVVEKIKREKLNRKATRIVVQSLKDNPEQADTILEKPISLFSKLVSTPEQLKEVLKSAPEEAAMEVVQCPHCGKELWINWYGHEIYKKQVDRAD